MRLVIYGVTLSAVGCLLPTATQGPGVVVSDPKGVETCQYLGEVEGTSSLRITRDARSEAVEQAARLGATNLVWYSFGATRSVSSVAGRAYRCPIVRLRHILYAYAGARRASPSTTRTLAEARVAAKRTLGRLRKGARFAGIARAESDCPTRTTGGDLGYVGYNRHSHDFERAARGMFRAPIGTLAIIESPFGVHVMKRTQ